MLQFDYNFASLMKQDDGARLRQRAINDAMTDRDAGKVKVIEGEFTVTKPATASKA